MTRPLPQSLSSVLCFLVALSSAAAFVPSRGSLLTKNTRRGAEAFRVRIRSTALRYSEESNDFYFGDLENARASLEKLVDDSKSIIRDGIIAQAETNRLFITSAGRRFREVEIDLLRSLSDSDAALEELIHLWTTERDSAAANDILHMQTHCSEGLVLEEARLCSMIREHPGWAEPFARLAHLLYHKGPHHLHHAAEVAHRALELKPFHFETLNLLVRIYTHMNDAKTAMKYQRLALPPLHPTDPKKNSERTAWVERALQQAAVLWDEAEHTTSAIHQNHKPKFIMSEAWQ